MANETKYINEDSSEFFIVKLDLNGICTYANEAYFNRFTEYKDKFIGLSYKDIVHADDIDNLTDGIAYCIKHPHKIYTTTIRKPDLKGSNYYCYCEFAAIVDIDNAPIGIQCLAFEVTAYENAKHDANIYLERTETILNNIVDGFFAVDSLQNIVSANKAFYRFTALKEKEVIGKNLKDVFPDAYEQFYERLFVRSLNEKKTHSFDEFYPESGMWFRTTLYPSNDGGFVFFNDITEKKLAEQRLEKINKEFETVFNGTSDTLFLIEVVGYGKFKYLRNNKSHQLLTGLTAEMFSDVSPQELLGEDLGGILAANYQRCVDAASSISYEETINFPAGTKTWNTILSPIFEGDRVAYIVGSATDITDLKKQEQIIRDYLGKFQQLSFLTSHELRHEYAKIQGIVNAIDNDVNAEQVPAIINEIKLSIEKINNIIFKLNDNLSFSQTQIQGKRAVFKYKNILLVDDDTVFNYLNKRVLSKIDPEIKVTAVESADEGLALLKESDTEGNYLVFLDLNMPLKTGWDFLDEYKNFATQSNVVILTSSIDNEDKAKANTYKCVIDFVTKPLTIDTAKSILNIASKTIERINA